MLKLSKKVTKPAIALVVIALLIFAVLHVTRPFDKSIWGDTTFKRHHPQPTLGDVTYISVWMTFDYLNKVFDLPDNYLKEDLELVGSSYPFITVKQYARGANLDSKYFLKKVQTSVWKYLSQPPVK